MNNEKKRVPPSKVRYLKRNPVVSFHLPVDELEKLKKMATDDDVTIATYVRRLLSNLKVRDDDKEKARQEGYSQGYR